RSPDFPATHYLPASVLGKCGTVSESDEKWGGQSWLPPGFYPAFSGVLHTLKSRLERRLQARLPAPQQSVWGTTLTGTLAAAKLQRILDIIAPVPVHLRKNLGGL